MRDAPRILTARFVVPVAGPVIEHGAVAVAEGRIVGVGPASGFDTRGATHYGDAVICPGFVNAHTHLELSLLAGRIPPQGGLIDWLTRLVAARAAEANVQDSVQEAVRAGVATSLREGVTTVGDITRFPQWTRPVLAESGLRAVSFGEVISIGNRRAAEPRALARAVLDTHATKARTGISPHSPYTVEPDTLRACADVARQADAPLCIHLLESPDEEAFTRRREGPFAEFLKSIGVWDESIPVSGCGPVELAEATGLLGPKTILAHVNYTSDADIARIAASGSSVAYCPRTHRAFGHPPHRFREMLAAGINVCIGTDSLASNPSLSILDELRFLRREYPDFPAEELLAMGTLRGAKALGLDDETGSITPGKSADLVVIPLETHKLEPRWDSIFDSNQNPRSCDIAVG